VSIRVLVADDQPLIRAGLVALFRAADGFDVAGEAADGAEAVTLTTRTSPDVVLMDIRMPVMDGIAATREILAATGPHPKVIVLTTFDLDEYVYGALGEGASGFLLKDTPPQRIISAIRAIADGDILLAPRITHRLIETHARQHRSTTGGSRLEDLTARETEVLRLVGNGLTNTQIAARLVVSEATVKTHLKHTMSKLRLNSRAQAVVLAYETGLVIPGGAGPP
jgi:DNA-binding NarL/FixJ family response regulator